METGQKQYVFGEEFKLGRREYDRVTFLFIFSSALRADHSHSRHREARTKIES